MSFEIQLNLNERLKYVGVWFLVHSALIMQNMNFFNIKGNDGKKDTFSESTHPSHAFGIWNMNIYMKIQLHLRNFFFYFTSKICF